MDQPSLSARLADLEDALTERKQGMRSNDEIRKAVVSFANSVPEGRTAALFIGVANDGTVMGIPADQVEKVQQKVRRICEEDCYPAIAIQLASALAIDGKHVVAFEFGTSRTRPHFAGHAYVRVGAESVKASASKLDELIAAKNTKAGRLLCARRSRRGCDPRAWDRVGAPALALAPPGKRGPVPKLQQQMERIQRLPKSQQRFVMQMIDTVLAQQDR
jgi:hypothetical protein